MKLNSCRLQHNKFIYRNCQRNCDARKRQFQNNSDKRMKHTYSMRHEQIVLRSFIVISRIDPIQIYNNTIEQQHSIVIQPTATSQLANQLAYLLACLPASYLFNVSTRYTLNKSTTHTSTCACVCACVCNVHFYGVVVSCRLTIACAYQRNRDVFESTTTVSLIYLFYCVIQLYLVKHVYK